MPGRLVVVSGTGTHIGKTHFSEALVEALVATGARVAGLKPIESGVAGNTRTDAERLSAASSFHVKPFGYAFTEGVSPHLAARRAGQGIDPTAVIDGIRKAQRDADVVVLELPGGLFSPITASLANADLAVELRPDIMLLVVPDRLGALHDAVAATRAADATSLAIDGIILIPPATPDASTGSNAEELRILVRPPVLATLPRADARTLAHDPGVASVARRVIASTHGTT
jgi:dethiobiotin synthetase